MQMQPLEVLIVSSKRRPCCKRPLETLEENYPVYKKRCTNLLICPIQRESSLLPENRKRNYSSTDEEKIPWEDMPVTSRHRCSTAEPPPIHQPKKTLTSSKGYNPFDFTSDELNPAYEWLRNTSSAEKCGAEISALLRDILRPYPFGLRLEKLEALVWSKHKIQLFKLSLDQGYMDSLQFLEAMPGIILNFQNKSPLRCLVQLDPAGGKVSH